MKKRTAQRRKGRSRVQTQPRSPRHRNPKATKPHRAPRRSPSRRAKLANKSVTRAKVARAITTMRRLGISLARAARQERISPKQLVRVAGLALRRKPDGRYIARPSDRLPREVLILTPEGVRDVTLRNSKDASLVGRHWNAVHAYLAKGNAVPLNEFRGVGITDADGTRFSLLTDTKAIDRFGAAGVLSFESTYQK